MVTNLPAKVKAKWAEVVACRSIPEKIRLMREFVAICPKHKGTSKLLANVRRKIAALEEELERAKARRRGPRVQAFSIPKEGAGQIIILGLTNSGKSSLLASITNAKPEVSPIPYMTRKPIPSMLQYEDIQFQLIEAPALVEGASRGRMHGTQILGLARNSDGLIIMVDLSEDSVRQFRIILSELEAAGMTVEKLEGEVEIVRSRSGLGVKVVGNGSLTDCTLDDVRRLLNEYKIGSAIVKVRGKVTLDMIEDSIFSSYTYKPAIIIANKLDIDGAEKSLKRLIREVNGRIPIIATSCLTREGLNKIGETIFHMLGIIRVYSKEPSSKKPSGKPVVVKEGARAIDIAKRLHSELYRRFRYARVWGPSAKYPGERVGPDHIMMDGDVIEIH